MSETKMNVSKRKNKTKKSAQEEEVTCWNCFTVEDNDRNLESVPLPKVREEHREKLKVYSFLASELSKPKAVPLKQKVSEHYAIGKKIDEKISCQVSAECLSVNNFDTSLNNKNDIKNESQANKYLSNEDIDINEKNLLSCQNQINTESSLSNKIISSENIKNNINQNETKLLSTDDKNISQIQECNNKVKSLHKENIYKNSIIQSNEHSDIETSFNKKPEILNLNNKVFEKTSIHDVYEDCSTNKMSKTVSSEFMSLDKPPNESSADHNSTKRLLEFNIKKSIEPERKELAKTPSIREQKSLKEIGKKEVESLHEENLSKNSTIQISENNDIKTSFYKKSKLLDIDKKVSDEIGIQVKFEDCGTNKILKTLSSEFMSLDTPPNEDNDHNSTKTLPEFNTCKSTKLENKTLLNTSLLSEHKSSENNCSSNISDTKSLDITEHEIFESVLEKMSKLSISNSIDSKENTSPVKTDLTIKQQKSPSAEIACKNKSSTIDYAHRDETNKMKQSKPLQNNYKRNEIKTTFENVIDMTNKEKIPTGASSSPMLSQTKIKKLSSKSLSSDSSIIRDDIQDACPSKLESPMTVQVFKSREITKLSPPLVTKAIERKSIEKLTSQKLSSYRDVEKDQNKAESTSDNIVLQKNKATNILPIHNKEDDKLTSSLADKTILFPSSEKKSIVLSTSLRAESVNTKIPILQKSVSSKYSPVQILRNKAKHYLTRNSSNASDKLSPTFIRSLSIKNYVNQENKQTSGAFKSSLKDELEHSACENIENANILFKVPINTSTPKEKRCESSDTFSESESNQTSLEIKDTIASNNKNDNASSNGSESGYAGSSANIQYLPGDENTSKNFHNPKDTNKNDNNALPHLSEHFKSSITSLNIINNKKPLQTSTMSLYTTSKKSPMKFLRWRTSSMVPRSVSFEDEVYMSEALSSPGHATLPRRSNSPLPNERDLDRDRFPINRSGLQARSESMASVYSGAGEGLRGSVTVRGEVQFSLVYNYRLGALEVGVKRCRDLAPIDVKRNRSDPYVKVYLLPDKSKAGKRKTKVKKNTLSPVFEETLTFSQPLSSLSSRTLWLSVWHADMFGRNDFLGEVTLPLADVVFDDPAPMWYKLHERTEQFDEQQGSRGDLIIGLKFELQDAARGKGTLHVLVKEAKNLVATKPNGLADVFCKSYLLPERGRLTKQKTSVCRRTLHPRWEHTFTYRGVGARELATRALELSLWDRDRIASNDFMGAVRLSLGTGTYMGASVNWMDSVGKEVSLWQTMMQRPNFWVEGSLPLRPQLNN